MLVDAFLLFKADLSPRTVESYRDNLSHFVWWLANTAHPYPIEDISDIGPDDCLRFFQYMRVPHPHGRWGMPHPNAVKACSPATIKAHAIALKVFFGWAKKRKYVASSPYGDGQLEIPKAPPPHIEPLTLEEIQKLVAACDPKTVSGSRNIAVILTMASSGLRVSELCAISYDEDNPASSDFDWKTGKVEVRHGKGDKRRTVYVSRHALMAIWDYVQGYRPQYGEDYLFVSDDGRQLTRNAVRIALTKLGKKAGVKLARSHRLRHFFATQALKKGMPQLAVQNLMGHSSDSTLKLYVSIAGLELGEMHRTYDPLGDMERETIRRERRAIKRGRK